MKLRNKKTGGVVEVYIENYQLKFKRLDTKTLSMSFSSLAELNEEWEDYEEPKQYWFIDPIMVDVTYKTLGDDGDAERFNKEIGNYFETREEAEKAVEKLKAITRLKSCGFKFKGWRTADLGADKYYFVITAESDGAGKGDLDLLFGGEE